MSSDTITVAMPVYNSIEFIEDAINSVLIQSEYDWKLVISDNASTDGTRELLKTFEDRHDSRISIYYQNTNLGIYENLNFLISVIASDVIHILCADDIFSDKNAIATIKSKYPNNSTVGAVRWNGDLSHFSFLPRCLRPESSQIYFLLHGNLLGNLSNVTFSKKALVDCGFFNTNYPFVGDFETWSRLAQTYDIHIFPDNVTSIRKHPGSATNYLNKNGEMYIEQADNIYNIRKRVWSPSRFSRIVLSIALSVCYDSQFRLSAYASALRGNHAYLASLNKVNHRKSGLVDRKFLLILSLITIGGRLWKGQLIALSMRVHPQELQ